MTQEKLAHIPSGWYSDPYSVHQLRWWDGHQWTNHTHAVEEERAWVEPHVTTNYVPFAETRAPSNAVHHVPRLHSTRAIWALALLPLVQLGAVVSLVSIGGMPIPEAVIISYIAAHLVALLLALLDERELVHAAHGRTAKPAWALLGSFPYLVARTVRVLQQTHHGSGPMWTGVGILAATVMLLGLLSVLNLSWNM